MAIDEFVARSPSAFGSVYTACVSPEWLDVPVSAQRSKTTALLDSTSAPRPGSGAHASESKPRNVQSCSVTGPVQFTRCSPFASASFVLANPCALRPEKTI